MLVKIPRKDTTTVVAALAKHVSKLPEELRRSLTWDQGKEMHAHKRFTVATNVQVYFSNRPIWVKHFRLSTAAVSMSLAGSRFSSDSAPGPSIMGFEDEVEQSFGRPCQTNGRFKRTYELTSSIVPRGTLFHHAVELECSPVRLDTVHDHGQPACQGNDSLLHAAVPSASPRP